jgi:hypothetical protein
MVLQFGMVYVMRSSLNSFWALINSQQNIAYLPIMSVNNPGVVNFYLEQLVDLAGFDPIPLDKVLEFLEIFDF